MALTVSHSNCCDGCPRRQQIATAFAEDLAATELRLEDVAAERDTYRELLSLALARLAALTRVVHTLRDRIAGLVRDLRELRKHAA